MQSNLNQLSDEDLMQLYQAGEMPAFETLYKRHAGRVLQYLQTKTSAENARDLLQEVWAKLHRARHQYSPQYPFLPWVFTITRNSLVDFIRLNETKVARESRADLELADVADEVASAAEAPDLSSALASLPALQKRAIELRYMSDWSFEQIAKEVQTTPANARQLISRGIRKIRAGWGGSHE